MSEVPLLITGGWVVSWEGLRKEVCTRWLLCLLLGGFGILSILASGGGGSESFREGAISAPTLSNFTYRPEAGVAGERVLISGSFSFVDSGGDLGGGAFNYTYGDKVYSIPLPAALDGVVSDTVNYSAMMQLDFSAGVRVIPVWLTDRAGRPSNVVTITFVQRFPSQYGSTANDSAAGVAIGPADTLYLAGTTYGDLEGETVNFQGDIFVSQLSRRGQRHWTRLLGMASLERGTGIAVSGDGDIYVVGYTYGPLAGETNAGRADIVLSRYAADGRRLWTRLFGGFDIDYGHGVAVDAQGDVYVTGASSGLPGAPRVVDNPAGTGHLAAVLVKYDASGAYQWSRLFADRYSDNVGYGLVSGSDDNLYVVGTSSGALSGENAGGRDAFVASYDASGAQRWIRQLGGEGDDGAYAVATDGSGGVFFVGSHKSASFAGNLSAGLGDAFLAKYDDSGNAQWVRSIASEDEDLAAAVGVASDGSIYVAGSTAGTLGSTQNAGGLDVYLAKFDAAGKRLWIRQFGSAFDDKALGVAVDDAGNIFVAGETQGSLGGIDNAGRSDIFLLKCRPDGSCL